MIGSGNPGVENAKYEINFFLVVPVPTVFGRFLWIRILRVGSGFLANPDSGKKFDPDPEKSPDPKHWFSKASENRNVSSKYCNIKEQTDRFNRETKR